MLQKYLNCLEAERYLYSQHAREEMEMEELGEITDQEVCEAARNGRIIERYVEDKPYPSCLIYGKTSQGRPLHIVCAHAEDVDTVIIITVYQPQEERWIDFERRRQ
jgi:hypothetical protein